MADEKTPRQRAKHKRPNRKRETINTSGLADKSAPDQPGETVAITVRVTKEQAEWLDAQSESRSYHVRQALKVYMERSPSPTDESS